MLEPAFDHVTPLVDEALKFLEPEFDRPYAFFGHSMGALIAFELTRELRRRSAPEPVCLFASGHRAPQLESSRPPIGILDDAAFVQEVARRYAAIPTEVLQNSELLELILPGLRKDISVCETYRYQPEEPLTCPIHVLGGADDDVPQEHLDAWRQQTCANFALTILPGDHFFLKTAHSDLMRVIGEKLGPTEGKTFGSGDRPFPGGIVNS
jgi:medium-chain acyl-[acyl-carrier-protein] hydrolase